MTGLRESAERESSWRRQEDTGTDRPEVAKPDTTRLEAERALRRNRLARMIEGEIIPRLLLAHAAAEADAPDARLPQPQEINEFARIVATHDITVALAYVDVLRQEGMSLETLFLEFFVPVAKRLGEWWEADLCDFVDVTIGLSRLQQLLRELGADFQSCRALSEETPRVLLAPVPGEQHTFGLSMVQEFFRRDGWDVAEERPNGLEELLELVHRERYALVGLSAAGSPLLDALAAAIRSVRQESLNQGVGIMVGGRIFAEHPDYVVRVGADATASDARQAVHQAQRLLSLMTKRC